MAETDRPIIPRIPPAGPSKQDDILNIFNKDLKIMSTGEDYRPNKEINYILEKMFRRINILFERNLPTIYTFFNYEGHDYFKKILCFPIGVFLSFMCYIYWISTLPFPSILIFFTGGVMSLIIILGWMYSRRVRCTSCLIPLMMAGSYGRTYIFGICITLLMQGPVANIVGNSIKMIISATCNFRFAYDMIYEKSTIFINPLNDVSDKLSDNSKTNSNAVKQYFEKFGRLVKELFKFNKNPDSDLKKDVESSYSDPKNEFEAYQNMIDKENEFQCKSGYGLARVFCDKFFDKIINKCKNILKFGAIKWLCNLINAARICFLFDFFSEKPKEECTALDKIPEGYGKGMVGIYNVLKNINQSFGIEFEYKDNSYCKWISDERHIFSLENLCRENRMHHSISCHPYTKFGFKKVDIAASEIQSTTRYHLDAVQLFMKRVTKVVKQLFSVFIFMVILRANQYYNNYISNVNFDNVYITQYFRRLDARRHFRNRSTLLPLKNLEKKDLLLPFSSKMSVIEKQKMFLSLVLTATRIIFFVVVFVIDNLVYRVTAGVTLKTEMKYTVIGEHTILFHSSGSGFISKIFSIFLGAFNSTNIIDEEKSNKECMPALVKTTDELRNSVIALFCLLIFLSIFEVYILRIRHTVCGWFYYKKEKRRIIHIYNHSMHKRIGFLKFARAKTRTKAQEKNLKHNANFFYLLQYKIPILFGWLKFFNIAKEKCTICDDLHNSTFHRCGTPNCEFYYCRRCWFDIKKRCYACRKNFDWASSSEPSTEQEYL